MPTTGATAHKLSELDHAMAELAHAHARTEVGLDHLRKLQERTETSLDRLITDNDKRFAVLAAEVNKATKAAGEAVNRAGRLVEDIVAPSIRDFFRKTFHWEGDVSSAIRLWRSPRGKSEGEQEFDAYAFGGDHFLLLSVKSTVSAERLAELLDAMAVVRDFFPEADNRKAYGAMASLYMDPSVVKAGERRGLVMIGLQSGLLTTLNSPGFKPAEF